MHDRRLLLASHQGVELLRGIRVSGVGVGRRAPSAIGRRAGGFRPPGFGAEVGTALRKAEGREARVSAAVTRRKKRRLEFC